jgi:hypothetical protein
MEDQYEQTQHTKFIVEHGMYLHTIQYQVTVPLLSQFWKYTSKMIGNSSKTIYCSQKVVRLP